MPTNPKPGKKPAEPRKPKPQPIFRLPPFKVAQIFVSMAETQDWGLRLFGIPALWSRGKGEGVRVAVLDTGAALDHQIGRAHV